MFGPYRYHCFSCGRVVNGYWALGYVYCPVHHLLLKTGVLR